MLQNGANKSEINFFYCKIALRKSVNELVKDARFMMLLGKINKRSSPNFPSNIKRILKRIWINFSSPWNHQKTYGLTTSRNLENSFQLSQPPKQKWFILTCLRSKIDPLIYVNVIVCFPWPLNGLVTYE